MIGVGGGWLGVCAKCRWLEFEMVGVGCVWVGRACKVPVLWAAGFGMVRCAVACGLIG